MTNYIFCERLLPVEHGKNARRIIINVLRVASKVIRSVSITSATPLPPSLKIVITLAQPYTPRLQAESNINAVNHSTRSCQ